MTTPKQAIIAHCKECLYDPQSIGEGTWRNQIENCTAKACPLYEHRPLTASGQALRKEVRYQAMTPVQQASYRQRQEEARTRLGRGI